VNGPEVSANFAKIGYGAAAWPDEFAIIGNPPDVVGVYENVSATGDGRTDGAGAMGKSGVAVEGASGGA
jgi:hypothetical protein